MNNRFIKDVITTMICLTSGIIWADPVFAPDKTYRISCPLYGTGSIFSGEKHSISTPIYYNSTTEISEDGYWIFGEVDDGVYTICNASTGKYITYDGERSDSKRYVDLTENPDGSNSQWRITAVSGGFKIALASDTYQKLNVRTGEPHMVGTFYSSNEAAANEMFAFYDSEGREVYDDASSSSIERFRACVDSFAVNGKQPVFDKKSNEFLLPVKPAYINKDFEGIVSAKFLKQGHTLYINGEKAETGKFFDFGNVSGGKKATVTVEKDGSSVASIKISFTFLPVVEISGSGFNTTDYASGSLRVTDADAADGDTVIKAGFRYRGATASGKAKKSYAIKLRDAGGESIDRSFFGLRSDNNWILDAMAIDGARMRNRVSTDLWLDFSTKPYQTVKKPKAINGTRGRFVEVLLNGEYAGLYCMTEKIDRKQLQLRKIITHDDKSLPDTVRGVLYKSSAWSYSVLMGHNPDNRNYPQTEVSNAYSWSESWDGWEAKYPDLNDASSIEWESLREALNIVAASNKADFEQNIEKYFDMPVFRDYYLFIELMLATDNHGKNEYLYNFDKTEFKKFSVAPWDMDGTWGMRWDGSETITADATQDFVTFLWSHEHGENNLFRLLSLYDYKGWKSSLAKRYAELRTGCFNPDSIYRRFAAYRNLYKQSGADTREVNRWNNSDGISLKFDTEMNYLNGWIHRRVATLDEKYGYDAEANSISNAIVDRFAVSGGNGRIIVDSDNGIKLRIYNIEGVLQGTHEVPSGVSEISGLTPGIYIVNGRKVIVK